MKYFVVSRALNQIEEERIEKERGVKVSSGPSSPSPHN